MTDTARLVIGVIGVVCLCTGACLAMVLAGFRDMEGRR